MDFDYSPEQNLLRESVQRFLAERYTLDARRRIVDSEPGSSAEIWRRFAEHGWLGVALPEDVGGYGGSLVDLAIVAQEFGRALVVEPFLATVALGAVLVDRLGTPAQRRAILPRVIAGDSILAVAFAEPESRFELASVRLTARAHGGDFILNGGKTCVIGAVAAERLIVPARTGGAVTDRSGISLFLVDPRGPGVDLRGYRMVDGHRAADVVLNDVRVTADALLGELGAAFAGLEDAIDRATVILCAEAIGALDTVNDLTLRHLKTRQQFGVPIGTFQALQHRMADMVIECEQARSLTWAAAMKADGSPDERRRLASAAKARVARAAKFVGANAVQLHGGMGMSEEHAIGQYFKRLVVIESLLGNVDHHTQRFAALGA
jgi:alkylation response protein AidB-like acyl-CoA dehydrogenase